MDFRQALSMWIFREFEQLGIEFAYPTHKLHLARPPILGQLGGRLRADASAA